MRADKYTCYAVLAVLSITSGCKDDPVSARNKLEAMEGDSKFEEVSSLPEGVAVKHTPEQIKAIIGGDSGMKYTWRYSTTVNTIEKQLTIVEFGCFTLIDNEWIFSNYTGKPFTSSNFEEWYSCPESKLVPGSSYSDPLLMNSSDELRSGKMLWYFIGEDAKGNKYQGTAQAQYVAELETE
ncbi:MAG: hypothetical protein ACPGYV_03385 [Phycisphaeraceae bacterium]